MPEYTLVRSSRRTLAIEITRDCRLLVRAPFRCPLSEIERFVSQRRDWIEAHMAAQRSRLEAYPEPDEAERARLTALARDVIPEKVRHYSRIMGLYPTAVTITGARTRFGSCSGTNRLCFSLRLMQYPDEAVDYVVVHELAHIVHKNHGREFYALVQSVLPDWRQRQALLR